MWQLVERDETKIDDWKKLLISLRKLGCWFFDCDACSTLITVKDGVELVSRFNRLLGETYLFKVVENVCSDTGIALGDDFQKEGMVVSVEGLYEETCRDEILPASYFTLPLTSKEGELLGLINLTSTKPNAFSVYEKELFRNLLEGLISHFLDLLHKEPGPDNALKQTSQAGALPAMQHNAHGTFLSLN